MIGDLFRKLTAPNGDEPLTDHDSRLALAALMVRVARTDGSYASVERDQIDRFLATHYGLDAEGVSKLRSDAEVAEAEAPDTVQFTRLVKDAVPFDERTGVVEALWRVAAADGIDQEERGFLRLVVNLLGVPDQESGLARQRAERNVDS